MRLDLNGRSPNIGDVIYRFGSGNYRRLPEMIVGFTNSGNPKLSRVTKQRLTIPSTGTAAATYTYAYKFFSTGYLTMADYVILDTPDMTDEERQVYNDERKKLGIGPLSKYGDS